MSAKIRKKSHIRKGYVIFLGCKVQGVECKGGNYSACTPRTGQVAGEVVALGVLATLEARIIREEGKKIIYNTREVMISKPITPIIHIYLYAISYMFSFLLVNHQFLSANKVRLLEL